MPDDIGRPPHRPRASWLITESRKALGLTQHEVADLLGMKRKTYHMVETTGRTNAHRYHALCEVLSISPAVLLKALHDDYQERKP